MTILPPRSALLPGVLLATLILLAGCGDTQPSTPSASEEQAASVVTPEGDRTVLYWRAPMDPSEIYDKPGKSRMDMDLVPVYADEAAAGTSGTVTIDPKTHHAILDVHILEVQDQKLTVLESFSQRPPADTAAVCDLKANPNDTTQYEIKV